MKLNKGFFFVIWFTGFCFLVTPTMAQVAPPEPPEESTEMDPEENSEEVAEDDEDAQKRKEAIEETRILLNGITEATNTLTEELNNAQKGKQVAKALEKWASALDVFSKKAKAMESKKGFKFLKSQEPPAELQEDLLAFNSSIEGMQAALTPKLEMFKNNKKFQKRLEAIFKKLQVL